MKKLALIMLLIFLIILIVIFYVVFKKPASENNNVANQPLKTITINNNVLNQPLKTTTMKISSPAFENNGSVPTTFTCDGKDINPQLDISNVSENAQSLVLVMDDPDSPSGAFVHWIMWNIDPKTTTISENSVPAGAVEGKNSGGKIGYFGPCPNVGTHHYVFKLYALDAKIDLSSGASKQELDQKISGHVVEETTLIGLYKRI